MKVPGEIKTRLLNKLTSSRMMAFLILTVVFTLLLVFNKLPTETYTMLQGANMGLITGSKTIEKFKGGNN